jgi:glycerol uptake facilitator-like aquaporin
MKRKLIFSFIGAIIIFAWQFISYAMPNFHKSAARYTPAQDSILQAIAKQGLGEGMYFLGQPDPSLSRAEQEAAMEKMDGKSWAVINFHETNSMSMGMNMFRGFLVCFVISFLLFWLFLQQKDPSLTNRLFLSLAVGMIGFFFVPYTNFIWYKAPDIFAHFADAIVPWVLLGFIGHKMAPSKAD